MAASADTLTLLINQEQQAVLPENQRVDFRYIGGGAYNQAWKTARDWRVVGPEGTLHFQGKLVYKQPRPDAPSERNKPHRFATLWKMVNPNYPVAFYNKGTLVPYLGREQASDSAIAYTVLSLYKEHGIIIPDAVSTNNMLQVKGNVVCIDFDLAYSLAQDDKTIGINYSLFSAEFLHYWQDCAKINPLAVAIIRVLVLIEEYKGALPGLKDYMQQATVEKLKALSDKASSLLAPDENNPEALMRITLPLLLSHHLDHGKQAWLNGLQVIHHAILHNYPQEFQACLDAGVDINLSEPHRLNTPLILSIHFGRESMFARLMAEASIDLTKTNHRGQTAKDYARSLQATRGGSASACLQQMIEAIDDKLTSTKPQGEAAATTPLASVGLFRRKTQCLSKPSPNSQPESPPPKRVKHA